ncbi:SNF2-related protein [Bombilactobacillus folatiphilus]|uniref:SNF2-related protein n=1 Tax=Bombilactobacillus folatiphilus TaxID=2923362 RepID=A0ABY4P843_9LACO|nr:helicase-related protein [Bombilactobacillus folatiphilus]UQS81818.1 SNF2-related protein [Bombilactobacillus folatiphilus]
MKIELIDNKGDNTLKNYLSTYIDKNSEVSIQTDAFSVFAFNALQKEIKRSKGLHVLLTKSFFEKDETGFLKRYEIAQEENNISGNSYEIKLRNQMNSAFIAREIAKLIKSKMQVHQLSKKENVLNELLIENTQATEKNVAVPGMFKFTADGLGIVKSDNITPITWISGDPKTLTGLKHSFDSIWNDSDRSVDVTEKVLQKVKTIYQENPPYWLYLVSLYHIFHNKLGELDEQELVSENSSLQDSVIWNELYQFQKDGVLGLIRKIEKYNGAILADSVGLGKTFSALAVIKYYELQRKKVLVLAPKRLRENWLLYTLPDKRNILREDGFNYAVLNHTDLSRYKGKSGDIDLKTFAWSDFDLIVIDESHNFRNNNTSVNRPTKSRYERLMDNVIKDGRKTKVLMLSATPINNRMADLKNQIGFITEGDTNALAKYDIKDIDNVLKRAQTSFNEWMDLDEDQRTTQRFLDKVNPDYFRLLDMLTIARSRKHIEKYYDTNELGSFPKRLKPKTIKPDIDLKNAFPDLKLVYDKIGNLNMAMYQPLQYVKLDKKKYYEQLYDTTVKEGKSSFKQVDREQALAKLIRANLLKRLESSINSFGLTINRMVKKVENTLAKINENKQDKVQLVSISELDDEDIEARFDDQTVGTKTKILLGDMDQIRWKQALNEDLNVLKRLRQDAQAITPERDAKLQKLEEVLREKYKHPINQGNKKVIIFTAFADTANYLYENLASLIKAEYGLNTALVTGGVSHNKTTMPNISTSNMDDILLNFSPKSKGRDQVEPDQTSEIDLLIATDTISEGQNLQDADYLINYDIHWNPVRVVQRFGRIDRIGSENDCIQLVNFWPNVDLDTYLNLEERVKGRMVLLNVSATGEEDMLNQKEDDKGKKREMNDLQYRKNQLQQLQQEVVDLEDVNGAISITDMSFNDFEADLQAALKKYEKQLNDAPLGMYAVVDHRGMPEVKPGVILTLKERIDDVAMQKNSILPYIVIFLGMDGSVQIDHVHTKRVLDLFKKITLNKTEVNQDLVNEFNQETDNGRDMSQYSEVLRAAIDAIRGKQEEVGIESMFTPGGTNVQTNLIDNLDEVELISFLIIK